MRFRNWGRLSEHPEMFNTAVYVALAGWAAILFVIAMVSLSRWLGRKVGDKPKDQIPWS